MLYGLRRNREVTAYLTLQIKSDKLKKQIRKGKKWKQSSREQLT